MIFWPPQAHWKKNLKHFRNEDTEGKLRNLGKELERARFEMSDLTRLNQDGSEEATRLARERDQYKKTNEALETRNQELINLLQSKKGKLETIKESQKEINSQSAQEKILFGERIASLESKLSDKDSKLREFSELLKTQENSYLFKKKESEREIKDLRMQVTQQEDMLNVSVTEIEHIKILKKNVTQESVHLQQTIEDRLTFSENRRRDLESELQSLRSELAKVHSDMNCLGKDRDLWLKEKASINNEVLASDKKLAHLRSCIAELEDQLRVQ